MFCFNCRPIVKLSIEGRRFTGMIENLTIAYVVIAILKLFLGDFNSFLNDILTVLMLVMTTMQANYFMAAILIFILLIQTFYLTVGILLIVQDYCFGFIAIDSFFQFFYITLLLASLAVNIALVYYTFLAYREYKALFKEQSQSSNDYRK